MSMLGLEDLDDLHKHLDHCHSLPSLCEGAMTALRDKLRTESSICFVPTVRRGSMHATLMASFGIDKQQTQLYKDYYFQIDPFRPLFQALARSGKGRAVINRSDLMPDERFEKTEYYCDFYRPQKIHHVAVLHITYRQRFLGRIGLHRPKKAQPFSRKEILFCRFAGDVISRYVEKLETKGSMNSALYISNDDANSHEAPRAASIFDSDRDEPHWLSSASKLGLSPRECDVVMQLECGLKNAEIASRLSISQMTVQNHIQSIYRKLGVHNRTGLLHMLRKADQICCEAIS